MVTMAENHAMNLSIIYHLTKKKAKTNQKLFYKYFFKIKLRL